ncbi:MAG: aminotransferase class I/II-fold pyridoxal phosphate-dependent enzyme, partial [Opitutae bacterium]|nr:aminotransferase class I/II-fold pyridoxal phosphate-dependent enzyme [Opitutae bacterium]
AADEEGNEVELHHLWMSRQSRKFNGLSYPVQRAASAVYTEDGQKQVRALTDFYLNNAKLIRRNILRLGFDCVGGDNSPYIWVNMERDSWTAFDLLLNEAGVVSTPGDGFGKCGKGHIRLSAFNSYENVEAAMERIARVL